MALAVAFTASVFRIASGQQRSSDRRIWNCVEDFEHGVNEAVGLQGIVFDWVVEAVGNLRRKAIRDAQSRDVIQPTSIGCYLENEDETTPVSCGNEFGRLISQRLTGC